MEEDPEDFFGDVADLLAPELVGPRAVHVGDEAWGSLFFLEYWVAEVGEENAGSDGELVRLRGGEVGEQEGYDDTAG